MGAQRPLIDEGRAGHVPDRVESEDARIFAGSHEADREVDQELGD